MAKKAKGEPTKQRTRKHIIASQSLNHVEKFVYDKGYSAERVESDYGYDLIVSTYDDDGYVEPGFILLQLKATDIIRKIENDTYVSFTISIKDYRLWMAEGYPVFLIVYDAINRKAYWLYFQKHFKDDKNREPKARATTVTVRIPVANELSEATIDYMRARKTAFMARFAKVHHHD
jgi:hypothetical protein